jgi:hypothetical protein
MDPDPAVFVASRCQQKTNLKKISFFLLKVHLHHFSKIKSQQEVAKQ